MKIITIANQKGGVAKTTTAITLAHGVALRGKETLLVDLDPQGQAASSLGLDRESGVFNLLVGGRSLGEVVRTTGREHLSIIPGDKMTATAQIVLDVKRTPINHLRTVFRPLAQWANYIVLDTSPSIGGLQEMAIYAADAVLIPTAVDYLSMEGVAQILETMATLKNNHGWAGSLIGILPTFYDDQTRESRANCIGLTETYGADRVLDPIYRATILRECSAEGVTIWERDVKCRTASQYARLLYRVMEGVR